VITAPGALECKSKSLSRWTGFRKMEKSERTKGFITPGSKIYEQNGCYQVGNLASIETGFSIEVGEIISLALDDGKGLCEEI